MATPLNTETVVVKRLESVNQMQKEGEIETDKKSESVNQMQGDGEMTIEKKPESVNQMQAGGAVTMDRKADYVTKKEAAHTANEIVQRLTTSEKFADVHKNRFQNGPKNFRKTKTVSFRPQKELKVSNRNQKSFDCG